MLRLFQSLFACTVALSVVVIAIVATPIAAGSTNAEAALRFAGDPVRATLVEADFINALNEQRSREGRSELLTHDDMTDAAAVWALDMAERSALEHSSDITTGLPAEWLVAGENVGRGTTVESLVEAFMESPTHRANVLDERFTHIGIGVYLQPDGRIYTTHRFAALPSQLRKDLRKDSKAAVVEDRPKLRSGILADTTAG